MLRFTIATVGGREYDEIMNKQGQHEYQKRQERVQANMMRRFAQRQGDCPECFNPKFDHASWCRKGD